MSEALCAVETCARPSPEATVCRSCSDALRVSLGDIPALADELDLTVSRQAAMGTRGLGRAAETALMFHYRASEDAWVLRNALTGWVRELDGEDEVDDTLPSMARWLLRQAHRIEIHPAGGEAVDEITPAVADVWRVIDRPVGTVYVGGCDGTGRVDETEQQPCGYALHAYPTAAWVRCPLCGATYDTAAREQWLLAAIEDAVGSPEELAACFRRLDIPIAYSTICAYAQQKRVSVHSRSRDGYPLYRGGDVLDIRFKRRHAKAG